jgi:Transposase DDE domain
VKTSLGGDLLGPNPTDREKRGTKHHVLTDQLEIPLSVVVTSANAHDMKSAAKIPDNIVIVKRRRPVLRRRTTKSVP